MDIPLAVLIVEDSESDAQLIVRLLKKADYQVVSELVETAEQMRSALEKRTWDVVISDYRLPQFDGRAALELLKEKQQDIPFILVSGAIGEETAVAMMKAGAHDYLIKGNLARLAPAVQRELEQAEIRRERKQAEQALRESEERYRTLIEQASDAIFIANSDGQYVEVNSAACKMLGYPREELLQMTMHGVSKISAEKPLRLEELQDGKTLLSERELIRKDGTPVSVEISAKQLPDGRLQGIVRDITKRKQAEDALRKSESFNQAILKNSPIGISVRSRTGQLLSANEAWRKIWAIPEPDFHEDVMRDRSALNFDKRDDYRDPHTAEVRRVYEQGGYLYLPELKNTHPRLGAAEWISQYFYAIQDGQGQVARVVILTENITERKQAHEIIQESEERLAAVMEGSQLGYSDWNIQTGAIRRNERWAGMLGYTLKEIESTYQQWEDLLHPDDRASARQSIRDHLDGKTPIHRDEYRLRTKDGNYRWILDQGKIVEYDLQGHPLRMTATHTDITELKQAEDQLRQLSRAVEYSPVSIIITDVNGVFEYVNPKFTTLAGYTMDEVRGKTPRVLKSNKTPHEVYVKLWQTILSGAEWRGEFLNRKKNGEFYWEYASISAITDSEGNITHFVSVNEDITARKEAEEKIQRLNAGLEQLAMTDYLTNLYNRRYFMQRGSEEFKRARRNVQPLSLLMLDIDEFKKVNDTYGHEAGDMALQQVSAALKACLREIDILGRMGGEEFAVLLPNTSVEEAFLLAERVQQSIASTPFVTLGASLTITITICIGVAAFTDDMSCIDDLLRNADAALYHAKHSGRNRVMKYKQLSNEVHGLSSGLDDE